MYHKNLNVWKMGIELVKMTYEMVSQFPKSEEYALSLQMRRSAVSIPSNIAEGCGRETDKDLYNFLNIASGSVAELQTQVIISKELGYVDDTAEIDEQIEVLQKLLVGFRKHIKDNIEKHNQN